MSENWEKIGIGALLENQFQIVRKLDPGGGGPVFAGIIIKTKSTVHIRFFSDKEIPDQIAFNNRLTLAKKAVSASRNTVTMPIEYGFYESIPYVVYAAADLKTMARFFASGEKLGDMDAVRIIESLIVTLRKVHAVGVSHLGLSPISVHLLKGGGMNVELGIIDFGLTSDMGHDYFTRPSSDPKFLTIAGYASPEQAALSDELDHRSDIYSAGALIYRILVGRDPFTGSSPGDILVRVMSEMPEGLEDGKELWPEMRAFLIQALQKDPAERFQNATEMLEAYGKAQAPAPKATARAAQWAAEEKIQAAIGKAYEKETKKIVTEAKPPARIETKPLGMVAAAPKEAAAAPKAVTARRKEVAAAPKLVAPKPPPGPAIAESLKPAEPAAIKDLLPEPFEEKETPAKPARAEPAKVPSTFSMFIRLLERRAALLAGFLQPRIDRLKTWKPFARAAAIKDLIPAKRRIWIAPALVALVVIVAGTIALLVYHGSADAPDRKGKSSGLKQQDSTQKPKAQNPEDATPPITPGKTHNELEKSEAGPEKKTVETPGPPDEKKAGVPEKKAEVKAETKKPIIEPKGVEPKGVEPKGLEPKDVEAKTEKVPPAGEEKKVAPEVKAEEDKNPYGKPKKKRRKKVDLSGLKILD